MSSTKHVRIPTNPTVEFDVVYDCDKLTIQETNVRKDPQIKDYKIKFRRKTVGCTPPSDDKWCTQECWEIKIDYTLRSEKGAEFKNEDILLDTVCCECQCVDIVRHALYWETKPGLESDGVTFTHIKSTPEGAYHETHFTLSWADESGHHTQEWDAWVFYREVHRGYTGLLKNGFSEIKIPIGDSQSRIADAERASGLEFAKPP